MNVVVFCFSKHLGSTKLGCPELFLFDPVGFRRVWEADSFRVSISFCLKRTSRCRVMTKNRKITSMKLTTVNC